MNALQVTIGSNAHTSRVLDLSSVTGDLSAEILIDDFLKQEKAEVLKIKVSKEEALPTSLSIDNVNGKPIDPLPLTVGEVTLLDGTATAVGEIKIKPLAKHFQKGINHFEVAYTEAEQRHGTEVILDVQF